MSEKEGLQRAAIPSALKNFLNYFWQDRTMKTILLVALADFVVQFIVFKCYFPYANYMPDSYSYISAASSNADVNMWPVAYSKFLRLVSVFSHSDAMVIGIQYFTLQLATVFFFCTLIFWIRPGRILQYVICVFVLLNPVPLFIADYISADTLFTALSLFWFSSLIWLIYAPGAWQIAAQAILLLLCFTLRYNAIYYPVVGSLAFLISRASWKFKLLGILSGAALVACSFFYTSHRMYQETGTRQFSAFGGWQLANNALYMYQDVPANRRGAVNPKFSKLELMVRAHMDTLRKVKFSREDSVFTYFYLWSGRGPLIQYLEREWKKDSTTPYFKRWSSEGPLYLHYGEYLIEKYPAQYAESFVLPNLVKYFVPPTEFLGQYNMGGDSVGQEAKSWFHYKSLKVASHNSKKKTFVLTEWYPVFSALANTFFFLSIIGAIIYWKPLIRNAKLFKAGLLTFLLWVTNLTFSVLVAPIDLRYQLFTILVYFAFGTALLEWLYRILEEEDQARLSTTHPESSPGTHQAACG